MNKVRLIICAFYIFPLYFLSYGQSQLNEGRNPSGETSISEKIHEIYGEDYLTTELYASFRDLLLNRIEFITNTSVSSEKFSQLPNIAEMPLMNKNNPTIPEFDGSSFSLESFNPLRYQLNFFHPTDVQMYRISETGYILIIKPLSN